MTAQPWADSDGRMHYQGCDGHRYCDTDPEDDRAAEGFDCLTASEEPCPETHIRPCGGCWLPPVSTSAYLAAEHRAQVRHANAGRGATEMARLVELGTMLQASLDASRDEHRAAQRALGAVHSTPVGEDPLPGGLHWEALDVAVRWLYRVARMWRSAAQDVTPWDDLPEETRASWRVGAREMLDEIFAAGGE